VLKSLNLGTWKTLFLAGAFVAAGSAVDLFAPLELTLTGFANKARAYDASNDIVIVSLDDYALEHNISSPIKADKAFTILSKLIDSGADKIVLSEPVIANDVASRMQLETLLEQHPDKLYIVQSKPNNSKQNAIFADNNVHSIKPVLNRRLTLFWRGIERTPYTVVNNDRQIVSAESVITGIKGGIGEYFHIDYAMRPESIPSISFSGNSSTETYKPLKNKRIIVGYEKRPNAELYPLLGHIGKYGIPTIIVYGANTLEQGRPQSIHWFWSLLAGLIVGRFILRKQRISRQLAYGVASLLGAFTTMIILNNLSIIIELSPFIVLTLICVSVGTLRRTKEKDGIKFSIHPESGLASVNSLRLQPTNHRPLIAARISGFDELMDLLSPEDRKSLANRIASLATSDYQIWHGENGHFYWFSRKETSDRISEHLESLALIMRNGFSIGSLPVSLQTSFGVDLRYDAELSDRILGASLSAKRAASIDKNWLVYEVGDKEETAWSITRLRELDLAISGGQIRTALQPKFDLKTGSITGTEALARWKHPVRGDIRPDEFVQAAEDGGRIKELTLAVMHSALPAVGPAITDNPDFTISINITPSLLADPTLCSSISSVLAAHNIAPSNLILEVTESTAFANNETCVQSMHELVSMGIKLSIDDYGTGNSTLEYLRHIPASELKIDRKFVSDLLRDEEDSALVMSTIQLAHDLNMVVVAEGVEDSPTLDKLRQMGCDLVQGYLISRPLPSDQFLNFLSNLRAIPTKVNAK